MEVKQWLGRNFWARYQSWGETLAQLQEKEVELCNNIVVVDKTESGKQTG